MKIQCIHTHTHTHAEGRRSVRAITHKMYAHTHRGGSESVHTLTHAHRGKGDHKMHTHESGRGGRAVSVCAREKCKSTHQKRQGGGEASVCSHANRAHTEQNKEAQRKAAAKQKQTDKTSK